MSAKWVLAVFGLILCVGSAAFVIQWRITAHKKKTKEKIPAVIGKILFPALLVAVGVFMISPLVTALVAEPDMKDTLCYAAIYKKEDLVTSLLSEGRSPEESYDADGWTPLICACRKFDSPSIEDQAGSSYRIAGLLLDAGADVNARDADGKTALMHAAAQPLFDKTLSLLLDRGADPDLCAADGKTALAFACEEGNTAAVRLLLEAGASVAGERNPLPNALFPTKYAKFEILSALLEAGADTGVSVRVTFADGKTADCTCAQALAIDKEAYESAGCPAFDFGEGVDGYEDNYEKCAALLG